jgi:ADP-ribose pyrophosphatase
MLELKNPWWTYRRDDVLLPNGREGEYHYVHVNGSSMIIPVRDDGKILLVGQYRYLCDRESIEFPCGSVKDGSTYESTARCELAEETGFASEDIRLIGEFNPYNGVTDEICRVYLARNLKPVEADHDETEEFELHALGPAEIEAKVLSGQIWDGMTLAAWAFARKEFPA